ncbi:MAG: hypothetical protein SFV55_06185 [Haliscomenobacter sp.]|uniref:hypothetical protein n=1 Tax=Haliscomenobacter sp. TaxID=2717303 RepID=UPI0029BCB834|nr:hypothetical protein [Haliscomenobacter sp.]MDX2067995.1 hypothetical protein [Haliscomenobacter sp.]
MKEIPLPPGEEFIAKISPNFFGYGFDGFPKTNNGVGAARVGFFYGNLFETPRPGQSRSQDLQYYESIRNNTFIVYTKEKIDEILLAEDKKDQRTITDTNKKLEDIRTLISSSFTNLETQILTDPLKTRIAQELETKLNDYISSRIESETISFKEMIKEELKSDKDFLKELAEIIKKQ